MRERDRGLERIADDVREAAVALESLVEADRARGVHENQAAELLGLRPERMELRIGEILAIDIGSNRAAAQAEFPDALLELLGREVRVLQCDRREPDEAVR